MKTLDLLGPCYCLASCLVQGDVADALLDDVDKYIAAKLTIIDPTSPEAALTAQERRELEFQSELLEYCYVRPGTVHDGEEADVVTKRRREAREVCDFFNVPWSSPRGLAHICAPGHTPERADAVAKAQRLSRRLLSPPVTEPSANKYTKMDPCVRSVALVSWFFSVIRKALAAKLRRDDKDGDAGSAAVDLVDADGAIGVPRDPIAHERRMGSIKLNKVYNFMSHGLAKYLLLVFIVVSQHIRRALFSLQTRHLEIAPTG